MVNAIVYKGIVALPTAWGCLELTETLLVPSPASNLFFVSRTCGQGARCIFLEGNQGAYVKRSRHILSTAARIEYMYRIE